ncbi:MAG: cytochrome c [Microthrixaceae bacterium]
MIGPRVADLRGWAAGLSVGLVVVATACSGGGADTFTPKSASAVRGWALATDRGCASCHSVNGEEMTGPSWKGLWGSKVVLESGQTVTVDRRYLVTALREPNEQRPKGAVNQMPTYGPDRVSEAQIDDLVAVLKELR